MYREQIGVYLRERGLGECKMSERDQLYGDAW